MVSFVPLLCQFVAHNALNCCIDDDFLFIHPTFFRLLTFMPFLFSPAVLNTNFSPI